jgi:hypothetical protein
MPYRRVHRLASLSRSSPWVAIVALLLPLLSREVALAAPPPEASARSVSAESATDLDAPRPAQQQANAIEGRMGPAETLSPPPHQASTSASDDGRSGFAVDLQAATHVPLTVGAEVTIELPGRVLAQLHVGMLPRAYANTIDAVATGLDFYDDESPLVRRVLTNARLVRPSLGLRPFRRYGFELFIGYTSLRASGTTSGQELADTGLVSGMPPGTAVPLSGRLHAVHGTIGWRFVAKDHFVLRTAVGYAKVLGSNVEVDASPGRVARRVERELEDVLESYVQSLELRLAVGYRF